MAHVGRRDVVESSGRTFKCYPRGPDKQTRLNNMESFGDDRPSTSLLLSG